MCIRDRVCITTVTNTHNFLLLLMITVVGIYTYIETAECSGHNAPKLALVCIGLNICSCQFSGYIWVHLY